MDSELEQRAWGFELYARVTRKGKVIRRSAICPLSIRTNKEAVECNCTQTKRDGEIVRIIIKKDPRP